jgi:hypothetical protein
MTPIEIGLLIFAVVFLLALLAYFDVLDGELLGDILEAIADAISDLVE